MYSQAIEIIEIEVKKQKVATRREEKRLIEAKIDGMCEILTRFGVFSQLDVKNIHYKISNRNSHAQQCEHEWRWHQVAGEGRLCEKCGERNFDLPD